NGSRWERILVRSQEQTVSILEYVPAERRYSERRYLLGAAAMEQARRLRASVTVKACSADEATRQKLSQQQAAIRSALPPQPDEWLVYTCTAAP
ncbi:MAG: serine protease, partial [Sphingomonas sp.]|nr:serine protease [Sphingomonas sp.]